MSKRQTDQLEDQVLRKRGRHSLRPEVEIEVEADVHEQPEATPEDRPAVSEQEVLQPSIVNDTVKAIKLGFRTRDRPLLPRVSRGQLSQENSLGRNLGHAFKGKDSHNKLRELGFTPIVKEALLYYLSKYPDRDAAKKLQDGFLNGFRLNFSGPQKVIESKNLNSAKMHLNALKDKISKEVLCGRMAGPYDLPPLDNFRVSPVGVIPKPDGSWRLITHLSFPHGESVNDGIDPKLCNVQYTSFDKVTKMIFELGKGALMAKRDIKSAFRLLPISPLDFHLLGIKVDGKYFVDRMLPMGLSLSCSLFETFSTFLHWLVSNKAMLNTLDHYLDDFILAGKKGTNQCSTLVSVFSRTCKELGIPIADEKSVDPTTLLVFLGLEIDSNTMSIEIPLLKIEELRSLLAHTLLKRKVTLKELQCLTGKLCFFSQAIRSSRAFLRRFYDTMAKLKKPFHHVRITCELKQDLEMWLLFLDDFNGLTFIPENVWVDSNGIQLFTDSAGSAELGCGCYYAGKWAYFPWPEGWDSDLPLRDITFLEMIPVLLSLHLWGATLKGKRILLNIDNEALVTVINKQSTKSKRLMFLIRNFVLICMKLEIIFRAVHVSSKHNAIADSISRMQWDRFRALAPEAAENPTPVPLQFRLQICRMKLLD